MCLSRKISLLYSPVAVSPLPLCPMSPQVTFETDIFMPLPGEEAETNPGCYGQALALWLRDQLVNRGVFVQVVLPEDFGWVVPTPTDPPPNGSSSPRLNVRCGNASSAGPIPRRLFRSCGATFRCWCPPFLGCARSPGSSALGCLRMRQRRCVRCGVG